MTAVGETTGAIGRSIRRHEDLPLVTGTGRYVADVALPGQLSLAVVRSSIASGEILSIDVDEARECEGVLAVWTAADIAADRGTVPTISPRLDGDVVDDQYLQPVMASDRVRYVGEPIAVVVAADRYLAEDAAELVFADIEPLPTVTSPRGADGGPSLFPAGNEVRRFEAGYGDADAVFASAPVVVEAEIVVDRHTAVPLETRGLVAAYDADRDGLIVYGATKVPHWNRGELARQLGIEEERISMRETDVGGGFGVRGEFYPEDFLVAWAAWRLKGTVGWIEDRYEHLVATNHARDQVHLAAIAGDDDGNILAFRSDFWTDLGAYVRTNGLRAPLLTITTLPGPYAIEHYSATAHVVVSNRTPAGTYRAPGRVEATFVRERLIDMLADRVGLSPVEVRRRNLVREDQMPYSTQPLEGGPVITFDRGDFRALFDDVVARLDAPAAAVQAGPGERVGVGVGVFVERSGVGPWEWGAVAIEPSGDVVVRSGGSSVGQGIRTALAQVAADALTLDPDRVRVELLDTDKNAEGFGTFASRSTIMAGNAVHAAARAVLDDAKALAAAEFGVDPGELTVADGRITAAGDEGRSLGLDEIAKLATDQGLAPDGVLTREEIFRNTGANSDFGVAGAVVRVDERVGAVHVERLVLGFDAGRIVNPMLVQGQLEGGAIQGLGGVLLERFAFDDAGNPLVTSFMDYLLPTAMEAPSMEVVLTEAWPSSTNPLGIKGVGEGGMTGVPAAVAGAVCAALGDAGRVLHMPMRPELLTGTEVGDGIERGVLAG